MVRLTRLLAIATMLQSRKTLTGNEIAERFDVSLRTAYRDIRTLQEAGIPVVTLEGIGYQIAPGFNLPPVNLTGEEVAAFISAEKLLAKGKDQSLAQHYASGFEKLRAALPGKYQRDGQLLNERTYVYSQVWPLNQSDHLSTLQATLVAHQTVRFLYHSRYRNEHTERRVDPYATYQSKGNWVLIGYCHLRENLREFRLDRMRELWATSQTFDPPDFDLAAYFQSNISLHPTPDTLLAVGLDSLQSNQTPIVMTTTRKEAFAICGITVRTDNMSGAAAHDIPALWARFGAENVAQHIPNVQGEALYCAYTAYEGDHTKPYTCLLGMKVASGTKAPEGMQVVEIEASAYAKTEVRGDLSKGIVFNAWQKIWAQSLDRTYQTDFECYPQLPTDPTNVSVEIYVGVGALTEQL